MISNYTYRVCTYAGCEHRSKIRKIRLDSVAVGVLAVPAFVCAGCGREMAHHDPEGGSDD